MQNNLSKNSSFKPRKIDAEEEEKVERMIEEWDIIYCAGCGAKISLLNSTPLRDGSGFLCKVCR